MVCCFQARELIVQVRSKLLPYSDLLSHWLSVFVRVTLFNFRTWRSKWNTYRGWSCHFSLTQIVFLVMGVICWKFYFRDKFMRERGTVLFGNAAVPEVKINYSFYVFGYVKKKKKFYFDGIQSNCGCTCGW